MSSLHLGSDIMEEEQSIPTHEQYNMGEFLKTIKNPLRSNKGKIEVDSYIGGDYPMSDFKLIEEN